MKIERKVIKIKDLVWDKDGNCSEDCPIPLEIIPNYMGINLCSVESISFERLPGNHGQLINLTINFNPAFEDEDNCLKELSEAEKKSYGLKK